MVASALIIRFMSVFRIYVFQRPIYQFIQHVEVCFSSMVSGIDCINKLQWSNTLRILSKEREDRKINVLLLASVAVSDEALILTHINWFTALLWCSLETLYWCGGLLGLICVSCISCAPFCFVFMDQYLELYDAPESISLVHQDQTFGANTT